MQRPGLSMAAAFLTALAVNLAAATAATEPTTVDAQNAQAFLKGLRERGYYELALDYLESLRKAKNTPADLRTVIDYEIGRGLLEEASHTADLLRRGEQLDAARVKLDAFIKANPKHELATEATVQKARILVERGHLAILQSDELEKPADKQAKIAEARSAFETARKTYDSVEKPLRTSYEGFPKFIPEGDPKREARDRAHIALMDAQLQRALVDYEESQTYPMGSKERNALLDKGVVEFDNIYKEHRTQLAGLYARMWEGKCQEEKGDLGKAMGIYNELMEHSHPDLRPLQRQVGYFRIIIIGKRKEYALAADEAARWLQSNPAQRHSPEGLGVTLELARNIIAQMDSLKGAEREAAQRKAVEALTEVVRYYSPHKQEALTLLQKYRPKAAANAMIPANLTYDDAMAQADVAMSSQEWPRAIALLKAAIHRADLAKDWAKANRARYFLAFAYYRSEHYYEAAVIAEHLARHYPQWELSAEATKIAMAAITYAYNTYTARDRVADLNRLIDIASYTATTWPDADQGDAARVTLGEIYLGQGKYDEAARQFEAVRSSSSRHVDALSKAGSAHWKQSLVLRDKEKTADADAEVKTAEGLLKQALKARQDAGAGLTDPSRINVSCDLAEIYLATDRGKDALALLDPLAKAVPAQPPAEGLRPILSRLLATELRSHIAMGQVDQALLDMNKLERLGGSGASLTQLYYELGRLLKAEMEKLQAKGDQVGYDRTQQAFMKFLQALVKSKAGQSYESLQWAGEAMLSLSESAHDQADALKSRRMVQQADATEKAAGSLAQEAASIFQNVLDTYGKNEEFRKRQGSDLRLLRTQLRLASAYRNEHEFAKASELIESLIAQHKGLLDPLMEKGLLLETRAEAGKGQWADAYEHWKRLASQLSRSLRKPKEYYEANYHVAYILFKEGQKDEAKKALRSVMRLSPTVGSPEIKAKYESLLHQLGA